MTRHDEFKAMQAGYVLLSLDEKERASFSEHLRRCAACRKDVAQLQAIAAALPTILEERVPPARLRDRIIVGARGTEQTAHPTPPSARKGPWDWRLFARPAVSAAALVLLVAVVGASSVIIWRYQGRLDRSERLLAESYEATAIMASAELRWSVEGTSDAPKASGILAYSTKRDASSMVLWGLPIDGNRKYIAWSVKDGGPIKIGTMWPEGNGLWIVIPGDATKMNGIGVTMRIADAPKGSTGLKVVYVNMDATPTGDYQSP